MEWQGVRVLWGSGKRSDEERARCVIYNLWNMVIGERRLFKCHKIPSAVLPKMVFSALNLIYIYF